MGTRSVDVRPMGMAGSASVPSLGTKAGPRPGPGRAKARPSSAQALADIGRLEDENEVLRLAVQRERTKYGQKSLKDFNSPARRRLGPMRRLLSEQAEVASVQTCALAQKEQALGLVSGRAKQELAMQARRQADLEVQEGRLAEVKLKQAEEEAHSAKAWEEHAVYAMMERRLQRLAAEDNGKITKVQEQIQDCDLRLGQWISVCKEGEGELAKAEGELEAMMQQLKAERQNRKKRLADRRSMAESMLQYATRFWHFPVLPAPQPGPTLP